MAKKRKTNKNKKSKSKKKSVLEVKRFFEGVKLPEYAMETDIGLDLRANENVAIKPLEQKKVRTGIAIKIPENHVGLIRDRAGIVSEMNVHTVAGTFDPAFRGEISVLLVNFGEEEIEIEKGMRVAQLIVLPITKVEIKEVNKLPITERYDKGFGSTGIKEILKLEKDIDNWKNESR